jgi:hypothetical protein
MKKVKQFLTAVGFLIFVCFTAIFLMHAWGFISYVLEGNNYPNYGARSMFEEIINWPWYILVAMGLLAAYSLCRLFSLYKDEEEEAEEK